MHVCKWPCQFTAPTRAVRIWYLMHLASPAGLRILRVFLFRLSAQCGRTCFKWSQFRYVRFWEETEKSFSINGHSKTLPAMEYLYSNWKTATMSNSCSLYEFCKFRALWLSQRNEKWCKLLAGSTDHEIKMHWRQIWRRTVTSIYVPKIFQRLLFCII